MADEHGGFLVTEPGGATHLPTHKNGKPDHGLMGGAWAALHGGYRGNKYEGPGKAEAIAKLKALYKSEGIEPPSETASEAHFAITLADLGAGTTRIPLAITGKWFRNGRQFEITADDLAEIDSNFRNKRNGEINVDYEHASEDPEVGRGGAIPSAGRIVNLAVPQPFKDGREIVYGDYEPTERARQLIASREYRYISPAITWTARNKQTGKNVGCAFTSVALTNRPFLEELPEIRLTDVFVQQQPDAGSSPNRLSEGGKQMAEKNLELKNSAEGKHQVFDGESQLGEMADAHLRKYAKNVMGMQPAGEKASETQRDELRAELLAELTAGITAEPGIVIAMAEGKPVAMLRKSEVVLLAECIGGEGRLEIAKLDEREDSGAIGRKASRRAEQADARVAEGFKAGKLTPA